MRLVYLSAVLMVVVGIAQMHHRATLGSKRTVKPEAFTVAPNAYSDRPTPSAKLYKLLWRSEFDYGMFRDRTLSI